jgi:hypothetical protein
MGFALSLLRREPARVFSILKALLTIGLAFGLHLSAGQQDALLALALLILGSGEGVRALVVPTAKISPTVENLP